MTYPEIIAVPRSSVVGVPVPGVDCWRVVEGQFQGFIGTTETLVEVPDIIFLRKVKVDFTEATGWYLLP